LWSGGGPYIVGPKSNFPNAGFGGVASGNPAYVAIPNRAAEARVHPATGTHFRFSNFAEALSFTNRVGDLAEAEGHHPAILTEWGQVTVTLWTHAIRGLHRNDFIVAAKIDSLVAAP